MLAWRRFIDAMASDYYATPLMRTGAVVCCMPSRPAAAHSGGGSAHGALVNVSPSGGHCCM